MIPGIWPSHLEDGELPLGDPEPVAGGDGYQMVLGSTLTDLNNMALGILVARLPFDRINVLLHNSHEQYGDTIYLITGGGRVIASDLSGGRALGDQVAKVLDARLGSGKVEEYWHQDGTRVVGTVARVPGTPWRVVTEQQSNIA